MPGRAGIARKKRAEAQKQIQATMQGLNDVSAFDTFDRMAEKVDQIEAEGEAQAELGYEMSGDATGVASELREATIRTLEGRTLATPATSPAPPDARSQPDNTSAPSEPESPHAPSAS